MTFKTLPGKSGEEVIFAIGDIHGQAGALRHALSRIRERPAGGPPAHLVFTGDVIDRGPDNLDAIDAVLNARELAQVDRVTVLPGNHEVMFLEAVRSPHLSMNLWAQNGGMALIDELDPAGKARSVSDVASMLEEALPDFMGIIEAAPDHLRIGDLLFVHAGISPHHDMTAFLSQPRHGPWDFEEHWLWIRAPFLEHRGGWNGEDDLVVVHGHTPHNGQAYLDGESAGAALDHVAESRRICLDAGAMSLDQVALLEVADGDYRIEAIHDPDRSPSPCHAP